MQVTVCKRVGWGGRSWGCGELGGGGVVVSEFSVAWGKRGEGGQGREGVQLPDSLMDEAVLQSAGPRLKKTEEAVCQVGGITCNAEGFAGETGAVDVLEGGERDTNDLLSCSHYPLKGLAAGRVAGAIPHSDAASQDALDGASVEGAHDRGRGSGSSEFAEEVETLLCFLGQCRSVVSPGEVLCDVHTQERGAARSLHSRTVDGQRSMLSVHSPEVNNNLLCLLHIQREIVVPVPAPFMERQVTHDMSSVRAHLIQTLTPPLALILYNTVYHYNNITYEYSLTSPLCWIYIPNIKLLNFSSLNFVILVMTSATISSVGQYSTVTLPLLSADRMK